MRFTKPNGNDSGDRRRFLQVLGSGAVVIAAGGLSGSRAEAVVPATEPDSEKLLISPVEVLMREHGVLERVLLIYEEYIRRLNAGADLPHAALFDAANIIRSFIEDHHERLEEDFLFPKFRKADKLVDLVDVLSEQHKAGRRLTDTTLMLAKAGRLKDAQDREKLAETLDLFIRMYSPHEAREGTVLYPAFRTIVSPNEYDALGEEFESKEHELFGEDGFEIIVDRVAAIEKTLGIYGLSQFTPHT